MPSYHYRDGVQVTPEQLGELVTPVGVKFAWFLRNGYVPHYWQTLFHAMHSALGLLLRFRHLVAGRRGGKTLSAAWEVVFYCLHPEQFHLDAHGKVDDRPLHAWVVTKDYPTGRAALLAVREVLKQAGFTQGIEYRENRGNRYFEFANGSLLEFKTAEDPQSLRGAGLDILWLDEAAFITSRDAWDVVRPALSDKTGLVITTTTPDGKNWFYDEFWSESALADETIGRVEYRSIDNPYFPREEWIYLKRTYHPLLFKQEYMASFDSFAGKELPGEWLSKHFYTSEDLDYYRNRDNPKVLDLKLYMGVDPAASLSDDADSFAMALLGVGADGNCFLLDVFKDRITFPDQLDAIREWHLSKRPMLIGVESGAYQGVLAQQAARLSSLPPIVPILQRHRGRKQERILSMSPLFKIGKVRVRSDHKDFIDEWLSYDSSVKNCKDDLLDAVEIALSTAGVLLPELPAADQWIEESSLDIDELARRKRKALSTSSKSLYDEHLGGDW